MAMLRHRHASRATSRRGCCVRARRPTTCCTRPSWRSCGTPDDGFDLLATLTREAPPGWTGFTGRVDRKMLAEVAWDPTELARTYVCGPPGFVEATPRRSSNSGMIPGSSRPNASADWRSDT